MINLLSTDRKSEIRAARTNVILSRYIGIIAIAIVFVVGVLYVSYTVLQDTMKTAEERIASNDGKAEVYSATNEKVKALSSKLADAKTLLNQETSYAKAITAIGQVMPTGTILDSLTIDETSLTARTPLKLTAYATTEATAVSIQQKLKTSPIFSQVEISNTDTQAGITGYPVKVTLTATLNKAGM